jgi:hypothetical protein
MENYCARFPFRTTFLAEVGKKKFLFKFEPPPQLPVPGCRDATFFGFCPTCEQGDRMSLWKKTPKM